MNNGLKVNKEELIRLRDAIQKNISDMESMCDECFKKIDDTEDNFQSNEAIELRNSASNDILKSKKYIDTKLKPMLNELNRIISTYDEAQNDIQNDISGLNSN